MQNFDVGLLFILFYFLVLVAISFNGFLLTGRLYYRSLEILEEKRYFKFTVGLWFSFFFLVGSLCVLVLAFGTTLLSVYNLTNTDLSQLSDWLKWILIFKGE
nr:MAG TPA: hypothetical protein [Caudoviricetes sp.]